MRRAALCFLMLLVPVAAGGTPDDPEIQDDPGDVRWTPLGITPMDFPTGHSDVFDILATWFHNETPQTITVSMQVVGLTGVDDFEGPEAFARWGTRFEMSNFEPDTRDNWWNYTWIAQINLNNAPAGWRGGIEAPDKNGERGEMTPADFEVDREAGILTVHVPRKALGSPMAEDRMFDTLSLHDGRISQIDFRDQSPDGTYPSRDYTFVMDTDANATSNPPLPGDQGEPAPATTGNATEPSTTPEDERSPASAVTVPLALLLAALLEARRRAP